MKTNDRLQKRVRRVRKSVRAQDLRQKLEGNPEVSARAGARARVERKEESMEGIGENIVGWRLRLVIG